MDAVIATIPNRSAEVSKPPPAKQPARPKQPPLEPAKKWNALAGTPIETAMKRAAAAEEEFDGPGGPVAQKPWKRLRSGQWPMPELMPAEDPVMAIKETPSAGFGRLNSYPGCTDEMRETLSRHGSHKLDLDHPWGRQQAVKPGFWNMKEPDHPDIDPEDLQKFYGRNHDQVFMGNRKPDGSVGRFPPEVSVFQLWNSPVVTDLTMRAGTVRLQAMGEETLDVQDQDRFCELLSHAYPGPPNQRHPDEPRDVGSLERRLTSLAEAEHLLVGASDSSDKTPRRMFQSQVWLTFTQHLATKSDVREPELVKHLTTPGALEEPPPRSEVNQTLRMLRPEKPENAVLDAVGMTHSIHSSIAREEIFRQVEQAAEKGVIRPSSPLHPSNAPHLSMSGLREATNRIPRLPGAPAGVESHVKNTRIHAKEELGFLADFAADQPELGVPLLAKLAGFYGLFGGAA